MLDVIIIVVYFVAIISIGLWKGRREKSLEGYALGDRSMPWWAILASILAAEISAATFLGAPGEGFASRNFSYAQLCIGTIIGRIVVGKLFLKPYYDYNVVSIYEYLEKRFGLVTRRAASLVFLISRALASGTRLYVAGIVLVIAYQMITDQPLLPDSTKIWLYVIALLVISLGTAVYTTAGGIKAVVWTDVIQACVLVVALGSALWVLFSSIPGGWSGAMEKLNGADDLSFFALGKGEANSLWGNIKEILGTEYTLWAAFLGSTFVTMATHGVDQDTVQRMLTGKDAKIGTKAVIVSGLIDLPLVMLFVLVGILVWVYYQYFPNVNLPTKNPEIFPYFIMHSLPAGVRGLLIAGLLATAMGSLSTALNSLATSATKDWYQDIFRPNASQPELLKMARWLTVIFALILIIIGSVTAWYAVSHEDARILPIVLGIFGYTFGSLLGVFLLGMLTKKRGNDLGNVIAMVSGFVVIAFLTGLIPAPDFSFLATGLNSMFSLQLNPDNFRDYMPTIAFPWRVTIGTLTTFLVGVCFKKK